MAKIIDCYPDSIELHVRCINDTEWRQVLVDLECCKVIGHQNINPHMDGSSTLIITFLDKKFLTMAKLKI